MNKNIGIIFYTHGQKMLGMEKYEELSNKLKEFFKWLVPRCDGDLYAATLRMDKAIEYFKISKATYYNWLNKLVEQHLMKKKGAGLYEVNKAYFKILTKTDRDLIDSLKNFQ